MVEKLIKIVRFILIFVAFITVAAATARIFLKSAGTSEHVFSEEEAARDILFDGGRIFTTKASFVQIRDNVVTIKRSGSYMLKGDLEDGQIVVDVGDEGEVKLKLNGLTLSCSFGPPVYVKSAKKVTLKLKADTENVLADSVISEVEDSEETPQKADGSGDADSGKDGSDKEDPWKACVYARSDLKIKGGGDLTVHGTQKHGIFSTKDLKIKSGTIRVDAVRQALHGKKSVLIEGGNLSLTAGTDGIHSNGSLDILGGNVKIDARKYGLYAFSRLHVDRAGGGSAEEGNGSDDSGNDRRGAVVTVKNARSEAGCQGILEY